MNARKLAVLPGGTVEQDGQAAKAGVDSLK